MYIVYHTSEFETLIGGNKAADYTADLAEDATRFFEGRS